MELTDIKKDSRGTILKFEMDQNKFLVIFTKKGALRAGETHNIIQYAFLIEGRVEVITKKGNKDIHQICKWFQKIEIPKGIPHYFKFLENSIIIENEDKDMTTKYYPEYRKLVEKSMNDIH